MTGAHSPLDGIRVLDLGRFPPSAYCTRLLAQQGAEVCRVDAPGSDPAMFGIGSGLGASKRSIALDSRHPRRNEVLRKLCDWADVVVENSRPGDLDERGFGYLQASEEHPELVWCSITGFGQDGPYALWPGHDLTYTAHSGLLGSLESEMPWHPQMMLSVPMGAVMAVVGIVSTLYSRSAAGQGCQLDISLSESATWALSGFDALINGAGFSIPLVARSTPLSVRRRPVRERGRCRSPYLGGSLHGSGFGRPGQAEDLGGRMAGDNGTHRTKCFPDDPPLIGWPILALVARP